MILGTGLIAVGGLMVWTGLKGRNGFAELGKLLKGEPAFGSGSASVPANVAGEGGDFTGSTDSGAGGGGGGGGGGAY